VALTSAQTLELEHRLDALGKEVRDQIREAIPQMANQRFTDLAGSVYDAGDESVATMLEEFNHTLLERHTRELRQIEMARKRLAEGNISECVECGDDIGYKRLLAHPVATRCIRCQAQHEKMYAGDTRLRP
jgi:RNA polymerase-binding transcription factor DksA